MGIDDLKKFERTSHDGKKYYFFSSVNDIVKIVRNNRNSGSWYGGCEETGNEYFYGTSSMDEAIKLAEFGWSEGTERLNREIKISNTGLSRRNEFSVVGGHVSVPRYLNGHPQNMIRKVAIERRDNIINLVRFSSVTQQITADEMISSGVKFIQLVQKLESQGYRCNVDVVFASDHNSYGSHIVRVRIKNSNERLNVAKMSFPMCHPSMFRRFVFKLREIEYGSAVGFRSWNSTGRSEYMIKECENKAKPFLDKNDYFIPMFIDPETFELKKVVA